MNKLARIALPAVVLVLIVFSLPFWLPSALALLSPKEAEAAPAELQINAADSQQASIALDSALILWDTGSFTGNTTLQVSSPPQLMAWSPTHPEPLWATETGFGSHALYNATIGQIVFIEQRIAESESLQDVTVPNDGMYSQDWPLYFTVLNAGNGEVISRTLLEDRFFNSPTSGMAFPVALHDNILYLMNYSSVSNLATYDIATGELSSERLDSCERGYAVQMEYSQELGGMVTLCLDYSNDMKAELTFLPLPSGEARSLEIPLLGSQDYMNGNGMALGANGLAYVLDSDAHMILEIDLASMQIVRTSNYTDGLAEKESSLGKRFLNWLLKQAATPAQAKRWFANIALSLDGQTMAVDGGMDGGSTRSVYVIDLETLQAVQELTTSATPTALTFASNTLLYVFFEKGMQDKPTDGLAFDLVSGAQSELSVPMGSDLREIVTEN